MRHSYPQNPVYAIDIEVFPNYTLFSLKHCENGDVHSFEIRGEDNKLEEKDGEELRQMLLGNTTFGFNSRNYDMPITLVAIRRKKTANEIYRISQGIISNGTPGWMTLKNFNLSMRKVDHFDIQEPTPGIGVGLKMYGMRMCSRKVIDLPYSPSDILSEKQMDVVKSYCENDLDLTIQLYRKIENRIKLREGMSKQYGIDLRSMSDAQIAEAVMRKELGIFGKADNTEAMNDVYTYTPPKYLKFKSPQLRAICRNFAESEYRIRPNGKFDMPKWLIPLRAKIGDGEYQLGIGGLHSCEKRQAVTPTADETLIEQDVASYYPSIIINEGLIPKRLGERFMDIYKRIVTNRLSAKRAGDTNTSESLKIVINGGFGKLNSSHSTMYAPELFLSVTITGQLTLLMLIERAEAAGVRVVSANTDGVVLLVPNHLKDSYAKVSEQWEKDTNMTLETTEYTGVYSRDVNNYLAIKGDGGFKGKGEFAEAGLMNSPVGQICAIAVREYLMHGVPISTTVKESDDITEFIHARKVNGGAEYRGDVIGKVVRWVYVTSNGGDIRYVGNGNRVAKADTCRPVMTLPNAMLDDIDYDRYIEDAEKMLDNIGVTTVLSNPIQKDIFSIPDELDFLR